MRFARQPSPVLREHAGANAGAAEGPDLRPNRMRYDADHTRRKGKQYRYYVSGAALKRGAEMCPLRPVRGAGSGRVA